MFSFLVFKEPSAQTCLLEMNESEAEAAAIPIVLQRMALGSCLRSPASSLQFLSQEGAFYSEPSLPINRPADRSRLILAQPQMSPIWFIPFTSSDEKELFWALHDMYILSGYHLQVIQRPHNSRRQREREEIFKSLHPAVLYAIPSASLRNHFRLIINS